MSYKRIIPYIDTAASAYGKVLTLAKDYSYWGADELLIFNYSKDEESREAFLTFGRELGKEIDIPYILGCYIERLEDVKKVLYTGASAVLIRYSELRDEMLIKEASARFGKEKIIVELAIKEQDSLTIKAIIEKLVSLDAGTVLLKDWSEISAAFDLLQKVPVSVILMGKLNQDVPGKLMALSNVTGIATNDFSMELDGDSNADQSADKTQDIMRYKHTLKSMGIEVNTFESSLPFHSFQTDANGLVPVIVQDYRTGEVLMLAYMNEEAYNMTIASGRMTYFSRSRRKLWIKGGTSGHYQYVKELSIDCDRDTILAKVLQIEAACHTGNRSCFYTNLIRKDYKASDPFHVLQDVFHVIADRKSNPKEGSYTNYLFDKGIDKILKKCGEEAAEIIIAAKNPNAEELRYEIADFLYHMMVLMAECGLDWEDILNELANRK